MKIKKRQQKTVRVNRRVKRGDMVRVLAGKDRGKKGAVLAVLTDKERVVVDGVNIVKKHVRSRRQGEKGQRVEISAPIHVSNVQVIDPQTKKGTRVRISRENGERSRVAVTSGKPLDA